MDWSILADLDEELRVPREWLEGARREGKVTILGTTEADQAAMFLAPFKERYPFIGVEHSRASREVRSIKPLVAYRAGRVAADILTSVGGFIEEYRRAGALEDLREIPGLKSVPPGAKDPGGLWVGINTLYWCVGYNTRTVKKEELPKRWEGFLTNPRWRGGRLALGNRSNLWALQLWHSRGEGWTKDFLQRLFVEVKPQLRKEGLNALLELTAAGEFDAVIPANASSVQQKLPSGAPLGFFCPEPVPASVEEAIILKRAPHGNAAKIFLNWTLSKEGQIFDFASSSSAPVHSGLRRRESLPFADEILGKEISYRDPLVQFEVLPRLEEYWNNLWLGKR